MHACDLNLCTDLHCSRQIPAPKAGQSCPATASTNAFNGVGSHHAPRLPRANPHSARGTTAYHFPRFPCMGLYLSRSFGRAAHLLPSSVSLFDLKARFFVPTRDSARPARAGAVKVGRRTNLSACSALARPHLDSSEHDRTLGAVGMTIRGEPAFGRGSIALQPCIRWVQGPEP
jgi:hypothetical protein